MAAVITLIGEEVLGLDSAEFQDLADPPRLDGTESKLEDGGELPTPMKG